MNREMSFFEFIITVYDYVNDKYIKLLSNFLV